jgi:nicotinamide riboside kinase
MEERYGTCPDWIREGIKKSDYHLTILLHPDLPWVEDPLRENPLNREYLFERYKTILLEYGFPWIEIKGDDRELTAIRLLTEFVS